MRITAQGPRLWNDLYCVEWDVKPSIPYHTVTDTVGVDELFSTWDKVLCLTASCLTHSTILICIVVGWCCSFVPTIELHASKCCRQEQCLHCMIWICISGPAGHHCQTLCETSEYSLLRLQRIETVVCAPSTNDTYLLTYLLTMSQMSICLYSYFRPKRTSMPSFVRLIKIHKCIAMSYHPPIFCSRAVCSPTFHLFYTGEKIWGEAHFPFITYHAVFDKAVVGCWSMSHFHFLLWPLTGLH